MSAANPIPWSESAARSAGTGFLSIFEHAPVPVARCNPQGMIVEMNPAFEQAMRRERPRSRQLADLVPPQARDITASLLRAMLNGTRQNIRIEGKSAGHGTPVTHWTAWPLPASASESAHILLMADPAPESGLFADDLLQAQRWEAVGRLAGGVVHDFNNLLTGVMLYCDLLISNLESRDRRLRGYAEEIRSAVMLATGLVRQLMVFARPKTVETRPLCLNQVAQAMQDLLKRLIGENIVLELRLDPDLGLVQIDPAQAQQVLLNLVLNARDAMPEGGRVVVETGNCKFQSVAASPPPLSSLPAFPCILLAVGDNGRGMDSNTRQHLFEPFFTTKRAGKGTGLGLTTIRGIVTTNRGLIHVESEPGRGTRVMILLPRAAAALRAPLNSDSTQTALQKVKKESLL